MDLGKWAFGNSKLVHFLIVVLLLGGLYAYWVMPKLEDPEIKVRQALVVGIYPGASAHQVELELVDPLEKNIRQMSSVSSVQSCCYADMCIITVELRTTIPQEELEQQWDLLRRKVGATALPEGCSGVAVKDDFGDVYGMFYALTGDGLSETELSDYAEFIKREITAIEGISRVDIYGKRPECIMVSLRQDKLANLGVLPVEVIQTLNGQNSTVYSGYFDNGTNRIRVTVNDQYRDLEDIAQLIIQGHQDDQLRLCDIAEVSHSYDEPMRNSMQYDGQHALGISISAVSGTDITKIGTEVEEKLAEIQAKRLPLGVEYHKVFFQPERVNSALNTFMVNLIESVLLVLVVLMIFMGFRSAAIIGYSLVVIVLGSILVLFAFDGTLQRVSLASFILAMGMLVDNAIVIVDGVLVDKKSGWPRMAALTSTGKKTGMPLLGATLIAILAFLPIFLSPDTAGIYVRDLFIVMSVSLLLSWILALVHVPLMAGSLLYGKTDAVARLAHKKADDAKSRFVKRFENSKFGKMFRTRSSKRVGDAVDDSIRKEEGEYKGFSYRVLSKSLQVMLNHRWSTMFVMIGLLVLAGLGYPKLPQAFFPDMEYDQLYMEYKLPEGRNYTQVLQDLDSIQRYLKQRPEVTHITMSTGGTPSRYNLVRSIATPSLSYGELIVDFTSPQSLVENMEEIQADLEARFPDAYIKLKRYNLMFKKYPIEAEFSGPDPAVLHQLSDSCRAIMLRTHAVRIITTDWEPRVPVLTVDYNQPAARNSGLSRTEVGTSLLSTTDGIPVGAFYDGINKQTIKVQCLDADGNRIEDLRDATVFGMLPNLSGALNKENITRLMAGNLDKDELIEEILHTTPLRQVSRGVDVSWEDPVVIRHNGVRSQRVQATPVRGLGTEEARQIVETQLAQMQLPEGYTLSWEGEKAASDQSMKYLFKNYPLAIILMIAILVLLFKDYKVPTLIFCCVPFIFIGVIPAMMVSGKTFGFVAIVGVLGLVGMMIKNGIVLMDEIKLQLESGKQGRQALIDSSLSRLRPVFMASLTTILGMIPLLSDAMFGSLAATIMGGLVMSTIVTLVIIPVLYSLFYKIK